MFARYLPVTLVLLALVSLLGTARARADGGTGWPDSRGDAGGAPDIIGLTVGIVGDEFGVDVDFVGTPPLSWSEDGDWTDVLLVFVSASPDPHADGFALNLWANDGPAAAVFAATTDGDLSAAEPGVVTAAYEGNRVRFRLPADRLPQVSSISVRVVATLYGGQGGMDTLPDDGGWVSLPLAGLRGTGGLTAVARLLATLLAAAVVGVGPLLWVHLRSRRMARLDKAGAAPWS